MEEKLLLTFRSVNHTMQVEKNLKDLGVALRTIPTPREISRSCGLTLIMEMKELPLIREKIKEGYPIAYLWGYDKSKGYAEVREIEFE